MKQKTIQGLMIISATACLMWVAGLAWTLQDYFIEKPPSAVAAMAKPTPVKKPAAAAPAIADDGSLRVVALGDSLTRGAGDELGQGYTGYLKELLKEQTAQEIVVDNLGINGQTTSQLAEQVKREEVQNQVKAADLILMTTGGNDLFQGGAGLANLDTDKMQAVVIQSVSELKSIVTELRKLNATAPIYVLGLYNPFIELSDSAKTTAVVRDWNYKASEAVSAIQGTVLVPTFDIFQVKPAKYLSRDQFHPNSAGYRQIAGRVAALITVGG